MRFIVLLLGLLGAASSGWFGWELYQQLKGVDVVADEAKKLAAEDIRKETDPTTKKGMIDLSNMAQSVIGRIKIADYFMLAGAAFGLLGGIAAVSRRGLLAALVLLLAPVASVALIASIDTSIAWVPALFTAPLALGGLLAFFIGSPEPGRA
jgi:hypothetical protein